jgi:C-terminal processing protease CtpA/Prc
MYFCSTVFISCEDHKSAVPDNNYVNTWILDNMQEYYFWNSYIPSNPDKGQYPDKFFYSLLYKYNQLDGDRFSWIQENYVDLLENLSGVSSGDLGFEYTFIGYDDDKVFGEVLYVKPGTNIENQGVKRGNAFCKINGTELDMNNYLSLLQKESMTITFNDPLLIGNTISFNNERDVTVTKARYAENPVFMDSIYEVNGKKIGYVIYNFFASDKGDNSKTYDKHLNSIFGDFKSAGVDNVIVDLRYNSGGSVVSATNLASMLASPLNTNDVFYMLKFNNNTAEENTSVNFVSKIEDTEISINNIGNNLQKLCFITSQWSASASEMVIIGLKPFMNDKIIIVGDATVGKSYASVSFYEKNNPRNKWGMQPLVAKYTNGNGELVPATGFIPDYLLKETFVIPKKQLGDTDEELLKAAINAISGLPVSQNLQRQSAPGVSIIGTSVDKKAYSNQSILEKIKK